jgi:hypothetical protein
MTRPTLSVSGPASEVVASNWSVVLNVPIALKRRSGRRVMVPAGTASVEAPRGAATPLQLALARGHRWLRMLETGEAASMCDIARREATNHSYVARHINLTLLAPDIVAAILDETLPEGVQLLFLAINPPMLWEDQRRWRVFHFAETSVPERLAIDTRHESLSDWDSAACDSV